MLNKIERDAATKALVLLAHAQLHREGGSAAAEGLEAAARRELAELLGSQSGELPGVVLHRAELQAREDRMRARVEARRAEIRSWGLA